MNILVTGGCGFIGSTVAERFYKEGHQIYIIDNLTSGQSSNLTIPHKFYQLNVEDEKCEEVFQSISPDIVVHLAAQVDVVTSLTKPQLDTSSNILGLVNILRCAHSAGVKKVIFASSAAVYGSLDEVSLREDRVCNPVSLYGINKHLGEYYCAKWMELYGLQTLCFRFSNVYGPRQGSIGEGGVVSIFMERLSDGKELQVHGDGGQTRDFIYVEDVVDAIYRGASSEVTGVYNLSTNIETSVNELIEIIGEIKEIGKVSYLESRLGDIYRSSLDNKRVKRDLDWVPIYGIKEGLKRTFEWFEQEQTRKQIAATHERTQSVSKSNQWLRIKPFMENVLAFVIIASLSLVGPEMLNHTSVDLKLIYIVLLGAIYGTKQSVISAILASGLYFYDSLMNGREWVTLLYDPEVLFVFAMYLFIGLIVGFISDKSRHDYDHVSNELKIVNDKYAFLKKVNDDTRIIKEKLQHQLINSKDSIGRIHSIIKQLESLEPEEIVTSSVSVLSNLMETDRISVYSVNESDFLRLMIKSNAEQFELPKTLRLSENPHLQHVIQSGKLFVNKTLDPHMPMLVAPVLHENNIVALVSIHDISFGKFNLHYENLFKVSVDLLSGSLSRAFRYVGATRSDRFIGDTAIFTSSVFLQVLQTKILAKQQYNTDFVLLGIEVSNQSINTVAQQVSETLRESDYLGMIEDKLVLLLSNSNRIEADKVVERLSFRGVIAQIISEDEVYG